MALFGEKYEDEVRVVTMGDYSRELCGGTHVKNTGEIGCFKILSENGIAAGVRRVEGVTSKALLAYYAQEEKTLNKAAALMKTAPATLPERISALQAELRAARNDNDRLKSQIAKAALENISDQVKEVAGVKLLTAQLNDLDMNELRAQGDQLKERLGEGVILLASASGEKVSLLAMATDEAMAKGAHAGNLIKEAAKLVGGGGGGKPAMAQAGGKNPAGIPEALNAAQDILARQLSK